MHLFNTWTVVTWSFVQGDQHRKQSVPKCGSTVNSYSRPGVRNQMENVDLIVCTFVNFKNFWKTETLFSNKLQDYTTNKCPRSKSRARGSRRKVACLALKWFRLGAIVKWDSLLFCVYWADPENIVWYVCKLWTMYIALWSVQILVSMNTILSCVKD